MKKVVIALGVYASIIFGVNAQTKSIENYKVQKIKLEEVNFISSYYSQDGNNSAVTGGIGTESLYDISNSFDLKFTKIDKKKRKHTLTTDINLDFYSSASSDNINPATVSGASKTDLHFYPSINWNVRDEKKKYSVGAGLSFSTEYDYTSKGINLSFSKFSENSNTELTIKTNVFLDTWDVILPSELRTGGGGRGQKVQSPRNTYNASFALSQVVNKDFQIALIVEPTYQSGLLATSFHRVYFKEGGLDYEKLPDARLKLPIGVRANYFFGDRTIIRTFYRYYSDDWGMKSHTINLEVPYKLTPFLSVSPNYRFNSQTAVKYFAAYKEHSASETFFTSDYDLSTMDSHFAGMGLKYSPPNGIMGIEKLNMIELRYGHYWRTNSLTANIITLQLKFK
jgi:hypothetical protein